MGSRALRTWIIFQGLPRNIGRKFHGELSNWNSNKVVTSDDLMCYATTLASCNHLLINKGHNKILHSVVKLSGNTDAATLLFPVVSATLHGLALYLPKHFFSFSHLRPCLFKPFVYHQFLGGHFVA